MKSRFIKDGGLTILGRFLLLLILILAVLIGFFGYTRPYKGVLYTADYKELVKWPAGCMKEEIEANGGVITPDMFHPNVEIIRSGSLSGLTGVVASDPLRSGKEEVEKLEGLKMVIFPWGVTHICDAVDCAINIVPDTVVESVSSNGGLFRGNPVYMSYPQYSSRKEPLHLSSLETEWAYIEYPWYEYYDIQLGWNAMPNGKAYYLESAQERGIQEEWRKDEPYMCRGWHEIEGVQYYFDDNGALTEAELESGLYEFDGVEFWVDEEGKVSLSAGWHQVDGSWRKYDENGTEEVGVLTRMEGWLKGMGD